MAAGLESTYIAWLAVLLLLLLCLLQLQCTYFTYMHASIHTTDRPGLRAYLESSARMYRLYVLGNDST